MDAIKQDYLYTKYLYTNYNNSQYKGILCKDKLVLEHQCYSSMLDQHYNVIMEYHGVQRLL